MKVFDIFNYSFSAIRLRKLRAALTTLGVIIGIAAIVALLSITTGLQTTITTQLNQGLAADTLIVTAGGGSSSGAGAGGGFFGGGGGGDSGFALYANYTDQINGLSPNIANSTAIISRPGYVQTDNLNRTVTIYGVNFTTYSEIYKTTFKAEDGRIPRHPTNNTVIVGTRVNSDQNGTIYFGARDTINVTWTNATTLPIRNETFQARVQGVLKEVGGFGIGGPSDTGIYLPIETVENVFNTTKCDMIIVKLTNSDSATITNTTKAISEYFGDQVTVTSSKTVLSLLTSIFSTIQLFLGGIAAISLLVAGIGIMNIMIVSMIERTREIGTLKALGMKSRTVLAIFLGESVFIGLIGAVIGIASGWALANVVATVLGSGAFGGGGGSFAITPVLSPEVLAGSLGFGIGVSVIFALYPAWKASKLKPVDALRYE
jgi:putative ABC transport system permease protein